MLVFVGGTSLTVFFRTVVFRPQPSVRAVLPPESETVTSRPQSVGRIEISFPPPPSASMPVATSVPTAGTSPDTSTDARLSDKARRAQDALSKVQSLIAAGDYDEAVRVAKESGGVCEGTPAAGELAELRLAVEKKRVKQQPATSQPVSVVPPTAPVQPAAPTIDPEVSARTERFTRYRNEGAAALERKDYPAAIAAFQNALKEQDDTEVRTLLEQTVERTSKPRLAVAEFSVAGNVGISDAGKTVAELLLGKFDVQRFQLIERTQLAAIMKEHDLVLASIVEDPLILRLKKLKGVRYLVVGTISRLSNVIVTARLVDVATGDIVQAGEVTAENTRGLQEAMGELAYVLQLSPEEKTAYLEDKRRRLEALAQADAAARSAAQAEARAQQERASRAKQEEEFRQRQRMRDATVSMADIRAMIGRGELESAQRASRMAVREYYDLPMSREFTEIQAQVEAQLAAKNRAEARRTAEERARVETDRRQRNERFRLLREQALAALNRGDDAGAVEHLGKALNEQEDPDVRSLLQRLTEQDQSPGLGVLDFEVTGNLGLAEGGHTIAGYVMSRLVQAQPRYRAVNRQSLDGAMGRLQLRTVQLFSDPLPASLRKLRGIRYLVVGRVIRGDRIALHARMIDLPAGRVVQTAELSVAGTAQLQSGLADLAAMLLMTDGQKRAFLERSDEHSSRREQRVRYDRALVSAREAMSREDYRSAYESIQSCMALIPDGAEARSLMESLGPVLMVTAEVNGSEYKGARVFINNVVQKQTTPAYVRLNKGRSYEVAVTIPSGAETVYTRAVKTIRADRNELLSFRAPLKRLNKSEGPYSLSQPGPRPGGAVVPRSPIVAPVRGGGPGSHPSRSPSSVGSSAPIRSKAGDRTLPPIPQSQGASKGGDLPKTKATSQPTSRGKVTHR